MSKAPFKARPVELDKKATVRELAHAALASANEQIRKNTRGARSDVDPDFTHQLRVGARRARVVVRLFKKRLGKPCARRLKRDLRWIFRAAGTLRDYDIVLRETVEPLTDEESNGALPALVLLSTELSREREQAARTLKRALDSRRYRTMLRTLRSAEQELAAAAAPGKRARKWASKRLEERLAQVLSRRDAALGDNEAERHELRKHLKELRYAAELVRSLWPRKRVRRYLDEMEALQDALGLLNDAATGRHLLTLAAAAAPGEVGAAVTRCAQTIEHKRSAHVAEFEPAFLAFERAVPFWR
jgi:triphosphatase